MTEPIHKTVFDERDWLRGEVKRLNAENARLQEQLTAAYNVIERDADREFERWKGREIIESAWRAELELSRKVADAAVAHQIASGAESKVTRMPSPDWRDSDAKEIWIHACDILMNAEESALLALGRAVREYRKLMEVETYGQDHA